jgi:hypothetical protein
VISRITAITAFDGANRPHEDETKPTMSTHEQVTKQHTVTVSTLAEFFVAIEDEEAAIVALDTDLTSVPSFTLPPGKSIQGRGTDVRILFAQDQDGLVLTRDNRIVNLRLETQPERRAIFNDTSVTSFGTMRLRDVTTVGRVRILARDAVRNGRVEIDGLDIIAADTRAEAERPHGFGVSVLQGAFTLWNLQLDPNIQIEASLLRLSAGREKVPVHGSGIFIGGAGAGGGGVQVSQLETGAIYSDGGIDPGTADVISGGVFIVHGCHAGTVRNHEHVTTYGPNDMVLDNWGEVDVWIAHAPITSFGPSGIGFVNFGALHDLRVEAAIETFGKGARGFNVYDGTLDLADFQRIVTHGDGAVGIQISKPVGRIVVRSGIETFGGVGDSLVKGVVTKLSAAALSIKSGGVVQSIDVSGGFKTNAPGSTPIDIEGSVASFRVSDGIVGAQ